MKIKLFKKCDTCQKPQRLNQFAKTIWGQVADTCKICEQKQFNAAMDAMNEIYAEEAERHAENQQEVFAELEKILCEDFIKDIYEYIEESDGGHSFKIVDNPVGDYQEEGYDYIKHIYVDQSCGVCGDDYYGQVYIPLPDNKYLEFSYEC